MKKGLVYKSEQQQLFFNGERIQFAGARHHELEKQGFSIEVTQ